MCGRGGFDVVCDAAFKACVGEDGCSGVFVVPSHAVRGTWLLGLPRVIDFIRRWIRHQRRGGEKIGAHSVDQSGRWTSPSTPLEIGFYGSYCQLLRARAVLCTDTGRMRAGRDTKQRVERHVLPTSYASLLDVPVVGDV